MARNDTDLVTALASDEIQAFNAVEIILDNQTLRYWTGYDNIAFGDTLGVNELQLGDWYRIESLGGFSDWRFVGGESYAEAGEYFQANDIGTWNGTVKKAYRGLGNLLGIDSVAEKSDMSVPSVTLSFSGLPSELVSLALQEPYQKRECIIYFGVGNDPYYVTEIFSGELDTLRITDTSESSFIALTVTNRMVKLERANTRRYTSESHKARYPNDGFFDTVSQIQDTSVVWGRKS